MKCALALTFSFFRVFQLVTAEDYLVSRRLNQVLSKRGETFNISLYHVNDIHAHLDEIKTSGTDCTNATQGCYGGYARIKGVVDAKRPSSKNSLFLNLGDEFQGTLFYSFYGGEKIAETINQLGFDAMTLGNHEFDKGEVFLGQFLKNLTVPVICGNIDSKEKTINSTVKPYKVFPEYKTAVIAVTTDTIPSISNPSGDTVFADPIATTQFWADYVYEHERVEHVIVMTHIGYEVDRELARKTKGIHMIVGGHSHTLLGDMDGAQGKYPTIEKNLDGDEVFIVTAWRYGVYLGYIDLEFDGRKVVSYTGGPILLDNKTQQDTRLYKQIKSWRGPFEELAAVVLGKTDVTLDQSTCQQKECTLGDVMCDAMLDARANQSSVDGCIINAGGIRATIDAGNITRGEILTAFPFGNTLAEVKFTGAELWKAWEGVVSKVSQVNGQKVTSFAQVSKGIRVTYNPKNPVGKRLINLEIGLNGLETVDFKKTYTIVATDFLAGGGDNIFPKVDEFVPLATQDEILTAYVQSKSPIKVELEDRIVATDKTTPVTGLSNRAPSVVRSVWMLSALCLGVVWSHLQ
ncbi:putative 5'-nucleotidase, C-terminal domain [Lyophyllum shimeji]|uniref:5'-nucleotidase, C-terminal domain n=1 Tax=Lyophyllum shimeji TaxID=47721 RepID=A0A9P3PZ62_LYOSH|nr:putative 5'-nucleotidase, C-terminal domain [Lyophyllum shimeji]